ncbi:MAG: LamG domain-containing protein, partial [Planctomycetales bacterium]|nr:LamG domain-containing protein [Planctomycetales bacterium]
VDRNVEFGGFVLTNYQNGSTPAIDYEIYNEGKLRILWGAAADYVEYSGSTDLRDDRWHLLTVVRDKDTNRFSAYVDGKQESLTPVHGSGIGLDIDLSALSRLRIGADANDAIGTRPFQGSMDEVAFYDRALSVEDIQRRVLAANQLNPRYLENTNETFVIDASNGPVDLRLTFAAGQSSHADAQQKDALRVDGSGVTIALQKAAREGESIIFAGNSGLTTSTLSRIDATIDGIDYIDLRGDGANTLMVNQIERSNVVDLGNANTDPQVVSLVVGISQALAEIIVDNDPVTRTLHVLRDQDDVINFQDGSDNWTKLDGT